jgi:8-amino-7-oxononanoate synthase
MAAGVYPYFQEIEKNHGPVVRINGKEIIMAGSNNYLGLSKHPDVIEASKKALMEFGTSCSGSRYLNGTLVLHTALEEELADYLGLESCLLFTTGFLTNQGVLPTVVQRNEYLITDKDDHASIVAGALIAKALGANIRRYKTNDMGSLEKLLEEIPLDDPKMIVTDGVFSMSGYIVNLPELTRLAKKYHARVMVDEAHSIGVLGEGGRGTCSHFGLRNDKDIDILMGTFSKSLASLGGFIAGERKVIEYIKHHSQALIFSASMAPANVAAVHAALKIIKREPERIERIREIARYMRNGFKQAGFKILEGITPIVPVIIGDDMKTFRFWRRLIDEGVFANAVISPAVPQGMQLIRTSFIATHENEHLDKTIDAFQKIGKEFGLIG